MNNEYEKIIQKFHSFEKSNNLKDFKCNGIDMWPTLKYQIVIKCFDKVDNRVEKLSNLQSRIFKKIKLFLSGNFLFSLLSQSFNQSKKQNFPESRDFLFLSDEYSKRLQFKGKWLDLFIDPYIHQKTLHQKDFYLLRSNQNFLKPKKGMSDEFNLSVLITKSFLYSRLSAVKPDNKFIEKYNLIRDFYSKNFNIEDFPKISDIVWESSFIKQLSKRFEGILDHAKPKKVILTHYLGYIAAGLTVAAKRKGLEVVDIQHGVQGKYHPAYNYRNFPTSGYNTTPNKYMVWEKNDLDNLSLWSEAKSKIDAELIGNGTEYIFKNNHKLINFFNDRFIKIFKKYLKTKFVVVTLCWAYYIPDVILKTIQESDNNVFFLIRFHPSTTQDERDEVLIKLSSLSNKNFEVEHSTDLPLYTLFLNANVHLAIVSTAILEGLKFGIKTIAIGTRAKAYYGDVNNENLLKFLDRSSDIVSEIKKIIN